MSALNNQEVLDQSNNAFNQWRELWDSHAAKHAEIHKKKPTSHQELLYRGYGKTLLCVAMGPSLEDEIQTILANRNKYDIACVDKAFTYLVDHCIIPDYVFVADAKVDFTAWGKKYIDNTENVTLIASVTSNPEWAENWKGPVYYYVNKDNIKTEERYSKISGIREIIPAGSNVGNSIIIFMAQIASYDNYLMIGYDFCWGDDDNYYAFNHSNKRYAMKHHYMIDNRQRLVTTSGNLWFSCRWLQDFINAYHANKVIINCSKGIFYMRNTPLEFAIKHIKNRKIDDKVRDDIITSKIRKKIFTHKDGESAVAQALKDLQVASVEINYIPEDALYGIAV